MAVKFFCDRCDKQVEGSNYFSSVTFKVSEDSSNWKVKRLSSLHKQLCNECALAIHEFISMPIPKEALDAKKAIDEELNNL